MIAGFTGTRNGMTMEQRDTFGKLVGMSKIVEFHHGECVGSDEDAHKMVNILSMAAKNTIKIVGHPPDNPKLRANVVVDEAWPEKPYLQRNRDIVRETECLIAIPESDKELSSGGTWFTIRYARQKNKPILLIWPDGTLDIQHRSEYSPVPWSHANS